MINFLFCPVLFCPVLLLYDYKHHYFLIYYLLYVSDFRTKVNGFRTIVYKIRICHPKSVHHTYLKWHSIRLLL